MSEKRPVLVLHGFLTPVAANLPIHVVLRRRGFRTFDAPIPGLNTQDIARSSELVAKEVRSILEKTAAPKVDLVGVSMGGLIALHYLRCNGGRGSVRRIATLGSPLKGVGIPLGKHVRRLPIEAVSQLVRGSEIVRSIAEGHDDSDDVVSIWADGDTAVSRSAASLRGASIRKAPFGTFPFGHYQLAADPRNLEFLAGILEAS